MSVPELSSWTVLMFSKASFIPFSFLLRPSIRVVQYFSFFFSGREWTIKYTQVSKPKMFVFDGQHSPFLKGGRNHWSQSWDELNASQFEIRISAEFKQLVLRPYLCSYSHHFFKWVRTGTAVQVEDGHIAIHVLPNLPIRQAHSPNHLVSVTTANNLDHYTWQKYIFVQGLRDIARKLYATVHRNRGTVDGMIRYSR